MNGQTDICDCRVAFATENSTSNYIFVPYQAFKCCPEGDFYFSYLVLKQISNNLLHRAHN